MVKKKRGSSLVTVAVLSCVLITVGTAMVSMTVGDYKMRMTESTRIRNLYSSESGLDVAYDILVKTFDAGVQYGIQKVDDYKKSPEITYIDNQISDIRNDDSIDDKDEQIELLEAEKNEMIDSYFKDVLYTFIDKQDSEDTSIPTNEDELRKSIKGKKYISIDSSGNEEYKAVNFNLESTIAIDLFVGATTANDDEGIEANNVNADPQNGREYATKNYTIKITSKYTTQDTNGTTERNLQSTYTILVPDYNDVSFSESNAKVEINPVIADKVLIIGGDMNVSSTSELDVYGNIFVFGIPNSIYDKVYDKYKGGLSLQGGKANFNGEVVVGKTFNIESNVDSTITGSLYAMNVYVGQRNGTTASGAKLTVTEFGDEDKSKDYNKNVTESGQVVIDNDLTLKANDTSIYIDKFYGINDKNIDGAEFNDSLIEQKERTSSSIIVNGNQDSSIKITDKAYIMGVAHIATDPEYQTGESTGVTGNYIAYASDLEDNEKLGYYNPLQLLDEDDVLKKSTHFFDYWKDKLEEKNIGGIELPDKTYSIGAIVYKDSNQEYQVKDSSYNLNQSNMDIETVIPKKRFEYALKVYNMGQIPIVREYDTFGEGSEDQIDELMTLNDTTLNGYILNNQNTKLEKAIFNPDPSATITIKRVDELPNENKYVDQAENGDIFIYTTDGNINAFIATVGNVIIDGEINFRGNIIAKGDLSVEGTGNKKIIYDKELCERIQALNTTVFSNVFGNILKDPTQTNDNLKVDYDFNKFISTGIWKIIK